MNWNVCIVEDKELDLLNEFNQPIELQSHHPRVAPNAGVELQTPTGRRLNAIYDGNLKKIRKLNTYNPQFKSMKNRDLALFNDHLQNEEVNTIVVDGFFGTGKTSTLCSHIVKSAMDLLSGEQHDFTKIRLSKPHVTLGDTYGFLPGDLMEKTAHEFASYTQYFDRFGTPGLADYLMLRDMDQQPKIVQDEFEGLQEPVLEILPFEYLLGRDVDDSWLVLDEAQNANVKEMSNFISRPTDSSKLVIMGDTNGAQTHRKGNTTTNNGLTFAKTVFEGKRYAGYVEMQTIQHIIRGQRTRDLFLALQAQ